MAISAVRRQKLLLRKTLRETLSGIKPASRRDKSKKILAKLLQEPAFQKAGILFSYVALEREVQTKPVILRALGLGKKVYVPKLSGSIRRLDFVEIHKWSEMKTGPYGILQPAGKPDKKAKPDLILVPGLGFDRRGGRIGQGAGYFDRFLAKIPKEKAWGLAFREQIIKKVPREKHDLPVGKVITD